jgi:peroxiredoxin
MTRITLFDLFTFLLLASFVIAEDKVPVSLDEAKTAEDVKKYADSVFQSLRKDIKTEEDESRWRKSFIPIGIAAGEKMVALARNDEEREMGYGYKLAALFWLVREEPESERKLLNFIHEIEKKNNYPVLVDSCKIRLYWMQTNQLDPKTLSLEDFEKVKEEGKKISTLDLKGYDTLSGLEIPLTLAGKMPQATKDPKFVQSVLGDLLRFVDSGVFEKKQAEKWEMLLTGRIRRFPGMPFEVKGTTLDGKPFDMNDYKGKYVVVDFTFYGCGPCREEVPRLLENYNKYKSKGLEVISIGEDTEENLRKMIDEDKITWTMVVDKPPEDSRRGTICKHYGIGGFPTIFLVGPDGKIISDELRGIELHTKLTELFNK